MRTTPDVSHFLTPLEEIIRHKLFPLLMVEPTSQNGNDTYCSPPLPVNLVDIADHLFECSDTVTFICIIDFGGNQLDNKLQIEAKSRKANIKLQTRAKQESTANSLISSLDGKMKRNVQVAQEKDVFIWLTAAPLKLTGFAFNKSKFRDYHCLTVRMVPPHLPLSCICNKPVSVEHALNCLIRISSVQAQSVIYVTELPQC